MSSGGVRNLRAMFENSGAASTAPERGRSPAESFGAGSNGTSPRPLSKVRTSFVTVEKSGQIGIRRDTSGEPSLSKRRTSFSIDEEDSKAEERKQSIVEELQVRKESTVSETIPEVAVEMEEDKQTEARRGRETTRQKEVTKPIEKKATAAPKKDDVVQQKPDLPKVDKAKVEVKSTSTPKRTETTSTEQKKEPLKSKEPANSNQVKESTSTPKATTRPPPVGVARTTTPAKVSPKKPPQPPRTPTTPQPSKSVEKTEEIRKTPRSNVGSTPPHNGFVKPRPRSPTRPVKLPASLTAHTASSGSKTASSTSNTQGPTRSLSRASATTSTTRTLNRKPSTLNKTTNGRPSLGPPPTSQAKKETTRTSLPAPAADDFLARMMRPTASSASKTHTTIQTTPPKKVIPKVKQVVKNVVKKDDSQKESAKQPESLISKKQESKTTIEKPLQAANEQEAIKQEVNQQQVKVDVSTDKSDTAEDKPMDVEVIQEEKQDVLSNGLQQEVSNSESVVEAQQNQPVAAIDESTHPETTKDQTVTADEQTNTSQLDEKVLPPPQVVQQEEAEEEAIPAAENAETSTEVNNSKVDIAPSEVVTEDAVEVEGEAKDTKAL